MKTVKFEDVPVGGRIYDVHSREYFTKTGNENPLTDGYRVTNAKFETGLAKGEHSAFALFEDVQLVED